MSIMMIIGESGTGKSRSLKNMDPRKTFLIKIKKKELPYRGERKQFKTALKDEKGNLRLCSDYLQVIRVIDRINLGEDYKHIEYLVIDDFFYLMGGEFTNRASEIGFSKFNEMAAHVAEIFNKGDLLRDDLKLIILTHSMIDEFGKERPKTVGKLVDKAVCMEGCCTCVFNSRIINDEYLFQTQSDATTIAKSPEEMFEKHIPNDLKAALDRMEEYYSEDIQDTKQPTKTGETK